MSLVLKISEFINSMSFNFPNLTNDLTSLKSEKHKNTNLEVYKRLEHKSQNIYEMKQTIHSTCKFIM